MATIQIDVPDTFKEWLGTYVEAGVYASVEDMARQMLLDQQEMFGPPMTEEQLAKSLDEAMASGISTRTMDDIFADAVQAVKARRAARG